MTADMPPRFYTILSVLNDLKDAFLTLLQKPNKQPALLMIYAFIDICAALSRDPSKKSNSRVFMEFVEKFRPPSSNPLPSSQLWAARSSLLHAFSPLGNHTTIGKAKPVFYYSWNEDREAVKRTLEGRGYADFSLVSINEIKGIAIWGYNEMIRRVENEPAFRERVISNGEHMLVDYAAFRVERFWRNVDATSAMTEVNRETKGDVG